MTGLTYLIFLICTGSMTGTLCPQTNTSLIIPLNGTIILPNETINNGSIYAYYDTSRGYQFTIHRAIAQTQDYITFKGDNNEYSETIHKSRVVLKIDT